jgi:hypothetical protein
MKNAAPRKLTLLSLAGSAAIFSLLGAATLAPTPAVAEISEQAKQACTPDVFRLCNEFVPDVAKITACMTRKRSQASAACRAATAPPHVARKRTTHHPSHH